MKVHVKRLSLQNYSLSIVTVQKKAFPLNDQFFPYFFRLYGTQGYLICFLAETDHW